jgi:hypothetical protein
MSWATCYSSSNNIHTDFPPLMSDGRLFSNFNPAYTANNELKTNLGIKNNYEYRQWLIKNGNNLIKKNSEITCDECSPCVKPTRNTNMNHKYLFQGSADATMPYGYQNSDLKNLYISRQALQSKLVAPIMTQEQLLLHRANSN